MNQDLRVAVSGIGWCGCEHIKAFQRLPGCEVVALHGRDPERMRHNMKLFGANPGSARLTTDFEDVINDGSIDIVSIAGVNSTHVPYAVAALSKGKHVMLEKPAARDEAELEHLLAAASTSRAKTVVSFELYWNSLFQVARWLVESGRIGKVTFVRSNYHSRVGDFYSGWDWTRTLAEGRSMLLNGGCHSIDAVRQFSNDQPVSVTAFHTTGIAQGYEYPTTIHVNIQFADGVLGQVSASADVASPYHFGLEIFGTELSLVNNFIRWPYDRHVNVDELQEACPVPDVRFFLEPYSETSSQIRVECVQPNSVSVEHHPFGDEARALVTAIREDTETPLSIARAAITHRLCFAADRSAAAGGERIAL